MSRALAPANPSLPNSFFVRAFSAACPEPAVVRASKPALIATTMVCHTTSLFVIKRPVTIGVVNDGELNGRSFPFGVEHESDISKRAAAKKKWSFNIG